MASVPVGLKPLADPIIQLESYPFGNTRLRKNFPVHDKIVHQVVAVIAPGLFGEIVPHD